MCQYVRACMFMCVCVCARCTTTKTFLPNEKQTIHINFIQYGFRRCEERL